MSGIGFWSRKKAVWYKKSVKYSDYPEKVTKFLAPFLDKSDTILDIGAGCGSLSIPLSKYVSSITAIEPSEPMLSVFKETIKELGIKNIKTVNKQWDKDLPSHNILLCACVSPLFAGQDDFLKEISAMSNKYVFLVHNVGPSDDKFFFKELYPVIYKKEFSVRSDFMDTYKYIYDLGIYANVHVFDNTFDQKLDNLEEAVDFWKEHLMLKNTDYDQYLKEFLSENLEKLDDGSLMKKIKKKSAIIWWRV